MARQPRTWSAWKPRSSRSPTPSGWPPTNAETALARTLHERYARVGDEAYALIREALATCGDIIPGDGQLLIRLNPLTAPRRTQALAALCDQLNHARSRYPGTTLILHYEVKPHPGTA